MSPKYSVLDIFAGAGGLSLGFQQIGNYEILAAFENDKAAKATYAYNHSSTILYDDVLNVDFDLLKKQFGTFDVIIGGPPCQGFSNANRQQNQLINMNNKLVRVFVEFIKILTPKAFLMENVKMLSSATHRFFLSHNDLDEVVEYDSYKEETLYICSGCGDIPFEELFVEDKLQWPMLTILPKHQIAFRALKRKLTRGQDVVVVKEVEVIIELVQAFSELLDASNLKEKLNEILSSITSDTTDQIAISTLVSVAEGLIRLDDIFTNELKLHDVSRVDGQLFVKTFSYTVIDYLKAELGKGYRISDEVLNAVNYGVPQSRERFIMVGVREDVPAEFNFPVFKEARSSVKDALYDLYDKPCSDSNVNHAIKASAVGKRNLLRSLRDSDMIYNHICTKSTSMALSRFEKIKQGENFHSLDKSLIQTYSKPERTQNSIYLRLDETKPSATVTNVRKAMWIHPIHDRAISIREAARLQSFPDSFRFMGTKDQQYQQVGNAVPPMMARALAEAINNVLEES